MAATVQSKNGDVFAEINTTPLIDVMLVLLTLLIITLPMQTHAIKIDMPGPIPPNDWMMTTPTVDLAIDGDGSLSWNGTPVDRATIDAYLATDARSKNPSIIAIRTDKLAKYDQVAQVLADASHAGEKHIFFNWSELGFLH